MNESKNGSEYVDRNTGEVVRRVLSEKKIDGTIETVTAATLGVGAASVATSLGNTVTGHSSLSTVLLEQTLGHTFNALLVLDVSLILYSMHRWYRKARKQAEQERNEIRLDADTDGLIDEIMARVRREQGA